MASHTLGRDKCSKGRASDIIHPLSEGISMALKSGRQLPLYLAVLEATSRHQHSITKGISFSVPYLNRSFDILSTPLSTGKDES